MSEIIVSKNFDYNKDVSSATYEKYGKHEANVNPLCKDFNINDKPELTNKALDIKNKLEELDKKIIDVDNKNEEDTQ